MIENNLYKYALVCVASVRCSKERPYFLLLDNQESQLFASVLLDYFKENGIMYDVPEKLDTCTVHNMYVLATYTGIDSTKC